MASSSFVLRSHERDYQHNERRRVGVIGGGKAGIVRGGDEGFGTEGGPAAAGLSVATTEPVRSADRAVRHVRPAVSAGRSDRLPAVRTARDRVCRLGRTAVFVGVR